MAIVDGLDVQFAPHPLAGGRVEDLVADAQGGGAGGIAGAAIGDQQSIGADDRLEGRNESGCANRRRFQARSPLRLPRTKVSSASTMPRNFPAPVSTASRKRCRQRKAVLTATPQRSADALIESPSARQAPNVSHSSLRCSPDKRVPVSAPKVRPQALHK